MHDEVIRARLMVRAGGLVLALLALPYVVDGIHHAVWPRHAYAEPMINFVINGVPEYSFYWWPMNLSYIARSCLLFLSPTIGFVVGAVWTCRGSHTIERRLVHVIERL